MKNYGYFRYETRSNKMAPLVKEIDHNGNFEANIVITAQHRDMLDSVLSIFDIQADHDLNIMQDQQTLAGLTANALAKLDSIINEEQPDMILVHGDTTTTFVGSLAAFYHQIPVGHVEAGLRTHQKYSPFPEELNRVMVSNIAELNFAPTVIAAKNLLLKTKTKRVSLLPEIQLLTHCQQQFKMILFQRLLINIKARKLFY